MPVRVLVVEDSRFFQARLRDLINQHPDLEVVGLAANGQEAVDKTDQLQPDIITMDFEMPLMDGITAIRHIMANRPTPILMFSSLTYEGARVTLDALAAGAMDFIPKDFGEVSRGEESLKDRLHERLLTLARQGRRAADPVASPAVASPPITTKAVKAPKNCKLVVIGASTGGPVALTEVLMRLPGDYPLPIVLVQHMPENFTRAFAERLDRQCQIAVKEAADRDRLQPGLALLAPGGRQLLVDKRLGGSVKVMDSQDRVTYKPSLDITFGSAANAFPGQVLGVVLTGMGSDGCRGAEMLKAGGSTIWSQDEKSSVIYGMPMAVARANLTDRVLALKDVGPALVSEVY